MGLTQLIHQYRYLIIPLVGVGISQIIKAVLEILTNRKTSVKRVLMGAGGMPSSHAVVTFTLTGMTILDYGLDSAIAAVSIMFSLIIAYDSFHVRYETGKHAKAINELTKSNFKEYIGHNAFEVFVGAILGLVIAYIYHII